MQYVELSGLVGVFIRLDVDHTGEEQVETILRAAQQQILQMILACRKGSTLARDVYIKPSDINKKGKACSCKYCDLTFYCRLDLVAHQSKQHPNLPFRVGRKSVKPCSSCGRLVHNLSRHFKLKHATQEAAQYSSDNDGAGDVSICKQCDQSYPTNSDHSSVCRLSPRCPECQKTFSHLRGMMKHRKVVHMGVKIQCTQCDKTFHDSQSLKKHIEAVHLKLKRVCPLCGSTVSCLSAHMNAVHADVRNFPCDMCEKKFKSNYDLTRHRDSVHLGNKAACPMCGKRISNLNQHIRVVHKQIKFNCTLCIKKYNTKSELHKHIKVAHPAESESATGGFITNSSQYIQHKTDTDDNLEVNGEESTIRQSAVSDIIRSQTKEENILYQSTQSIRDFQSYPMKEAQYSEPKEYLYSTNSSSLKEPTSSFVLPVPEQPSEDQLITQYLTKHSLSLPSSNAKDDRSNVEQSIMSHKEENYYLQYGFNRARPPDSKYIELRSINSFESARNNMRPISEICPTVQQNEDNILIYRNASIDNPAKVRLLPNEECDNETTIMDDQRNQFNKQDKTLQLIQHGDVNESMNEHVNERDDYIEYHHQHSLQHVAESSREQY